MPTNAARTIGRIDADHLPRLDPLHPALRVDLGRPRPDTATFELSGELDTATVPLLVACLESALVQPAREVVISLAHVDFLGVRGLEAVLDARDELARTGVTLSLAAVPPGIRRVLALTAMDAGIAVYSTVAEALGRRAA